MFVWVFLLSNMSACDMDKKPDRPSNAHIQELDVSNDLEKKQNRIRNYWDDFYYSEQKNEMFLTIHNAENGDTIVIKPGTYWGAVRMMDKHNLTIDFSNVSLLTKYDETLFKISDCSNIHIHGLTIYHDPRLIGCFTNCFDVEYSQNISFSNCDINGSGFIGVCINQCSRVELKDCKIHECQFGVYVWGGNDEYGGKKVSSSEVFIENCVFAQNDASNVSFDPNYARATQFSIKINAWNFRINSKNMMRFLTDDYHYEVNPKKPEQMMSDVISILSTTAYSAGDLDPNIENISWVGLFRNDFENSIKCYTTKLNTKPIHSPMDDEVGEMSGIGIYCEGHEKDPILLISGIEIPEDVQIDSYNTLKNSLMPGESMHLGNCIIKAFGDIDYYGDITDYQLTITGEKNGENIEQIFLEQADYDQTIIHFIWSGDIDQDGFPDLYMDISHMYSSFSIPALFLSSKAGENELLKLVAEDQLSGC